MKMEAEIGVILAQDMEQLGLPEVGIGKEGFSPTCFRGNMAP